MGKIILKLAGYIVPFLLFGLATAVLLPLNYFSFRPWEALVVYAGGRVLLPGPFYPLKSVAMTEEGDLGHGTPYAVKKEVYWETDRYGFRKADSAVPPEVVVVGDSMIAGAGLTQREIFSEVLQGKIGSSVYPYAPGDVIDFLHERRFQAAPPKLVILEQVESSILGTPSIEEVHRIGSRVRSLVRSCASAASPSTREANVVLDRMVKKEPFNYLQAQIFPRRSAPRYHGLFFRRGTAAVATKEEIRAAVAVIRGYHDYFRKRNIRFIYMPIPDKETVYYDLLPVKEQSFVLKEVLHGVRQAGVPAVDLLGPYQERRAHGVHPYHADDTHWNPTGVTIAADLAARLIAHAQ